MKHYLLTSIREILLLHNFNALVDLATREGLYTTRMPARKMGYSYTITENGILVCHQRKWFARRKFGAPMPHCVAVRAVSRGFCLSTMHFRCRDASFFAYIFQTNIELE